MVDLTEKLENWSSALVDFGPKLLMAIAAIVIGWWLIKHILRLIGKIMDRTNMSKEVQPFLKSLLGALLKILLIFSVAEMIGIKTTSFIAMLAAVGFAIGMALQGSLSNFAAGVMILVFKPYRVGDIVEIEGTKGDVKEVQIFNTIIETPLNETVIIPNGLAIANKIVNHSAMGSVRVDVFASMPYDEDLSKVRSSILELCALNPKILKNPETSVGIENFDSHNIQFGVFAFSKPEDYWDVYYAAHEIIKKAMGKHDIKMAYSEGVEYGVISPN